MTTATAPRPSLSALDRCDRCGAQASVRVELTGGRDLLFCTHHAREHADRLQEVASRIVDESGAMSR